MDEALETLSADKQEDNEGIMANCAGNLLTRQGRFEEADEKYRAALSIQNNNVEYLCNRATCQIKLGYFGEADDLLAKAHLISPNPEVLEMISFVAAKKGEYPRAELACRSALEIDPCHVPSLLSLGWILVNQGKKEEAGETLKLLDKLTLKEDAEKSREELRDRLNEYLYTSVFCATCDRSRKVLKDSPEAPAIRLFSMPPDEMPAGSCLACGKTYCIGCAKKNLDPEGKFICPDCNQSLKLINEGLKMMTYEWAEKEGLI
jgi:tetratricopeptide (TPR) repeat protein